VIPPEFTLHSPVDGPRRQREMIYQIYPRSSADSNSDRAGDLQGVLDHLAWLEVGSMRLPAITICPNKDSDCDVSDYCDVDPPYGVLDLFGRLVAARGGIDIVGDLVHNDTTSRHRWFIDALGGRSTHYREWQCGLIRVLTANRRLLGVHIRRTGFGASSSRAVSTTWS